MSSLATLEGDEAFEASLLGHAEEVAQERISDDELIFIRGPKARTASSIVLRSEFRLLRILAPNLGNKLLTNASIYCFGGLW